MGFCFIIVLCVTIEVVIPLKVSSGRMAMIVLVK